MIRIHDHEHFQSVVEYAQSINKLYDFLSAFNQACFSTYFGKPCDVEILKDFAPYSFLFHIKVNNTIEMAGGIIFHQSDQSWSVHT